MENLTVQNENVSNELKSNLNDASAKQIKKSAFRKKIEAEQKPIVATEKKKEVAKEKKSTTKKLNEVVAIAVSSENKYLYLFQKTEKLSAVDQKKRRSAIRRKLFSFADAIFLANKAKNTDKLNESIKEFKTFHKLTYVNTKLELKNIFTSDKDEKKTADLQNMINIIKKSASAIEFNF